MTVSNLDKNLHDSIKRLSDAQKESVLAYIHKIAPSSGNDIYTVEHYNRELYEAEAAIERGEFYSNEEVFAMANQIINGRK